MYSWLSRIFQAGPDDSDNALTIPEEGRAPAQMDLDTAQSTNGSRGLDRKPSSITLERVRSNGPSHVAWLPSPNYSGSGSLTPRPWGRQPNGSPLPSPSLSQDSPTPSRSGYFAPRTPTARRVSSESLRLQSVHLSETSDASSISSARQRKMLSPIEEQEQEQHVPTVHFPSSTRRPSLDSFPRTPDSGSHPAFLTRPLNRTTSQSSTSTLLSTISVAAPSIPPLDLRPPFPGGTLHIPPRKSHLAPPSLPTVVGSPHSHVSVIYEGKANAGQMSVSSFQTAQSDSAIMVDESDITENRLHLFDRDTERDEEEDGRFRDSLGLRETYVSTDLDTESNSSMTPTQDERYPAYPEGLYEVDLGGDSPLTRSRNISPFDDPDAHILEHHRLEQLRQIHHGDQPIQQHHRTPDIPSNASHRTFATSSSTTRVEFAIHSRWLKTAQWGAHPFTCPKGPKQRKVTSAFVLFWIGFLAPWCWLIGGWYLSRSGEMLPDKKDPYKVHWPWSKEDVHTGSGGNGNVQEKGTGGQAQANGGVGEKLKSFWHHHIASHSRETLPMSTKDIPKHSRPHLRTKHQSQKTAGYIDPWVHYCRVAAVISGTLLCVALIVALVVVSAFP
ncbi:unnamed protein product [Somion occarium]|uniref:Serine-rich protein n=1 Tax=Somion occarium TaxID=3059160 RepID=A0ABP1DPX3_9APHY